MMSIVRFVILVGMSLFLLQAKAEVLRGVNVDDRLTFSDFKDIKSLGVNLVRVSFARKPLMSSIESEDLDSAAVKVLDNYIEYASKLGLKLLVDPHYFPGMAGKYSMKPTDLFWTDVKYQRQFLHTWELIARRYANVSPEVLFGYDLINEAAPPRLVSGERGCTVLRSIIGGALKAIRRYDNKRTIILQFPMALGVMGGPTNQMDDLDCLGFWGNSGVWYSFHMYDPGRFTHQGVLGFRTPVYLYRGKDPAAVQGMLRARVGSVLRFQERYGAKILVGEFGASVFSGAEGSLYIRQLIEIFEGYGWSWAFHSFRESPVWDPEAPERDGSEDTLKLDERRMPKTRIGILREFITGPK
ncbi:glycoside hydrolase family 5 protein [Cupriavidus necator]